MIITERTALKLSVYANSSLAAYAVILAWYSKSIVILMEASFVSVTLVMSIITVRISRLLNEKPSQKLPFGFAFLEPFLNLFKGGLLSVIALYGIWMSLQAMFSNPKPINSVFPIIYGGGTFLVCFCVMILQRQALKRFESPILKLEMIDFASSSGIALGILAAFAIGHFLTGTEWGAYVPYIDPIVTILILAFIIPMFWAIIMDSVRSLLQIGHDVDTEERVNQWLGETQAFPPGEVSVQKIGRKLYIIVALKVSQKFNQHRLGPIMEAREELCKKIEGVFPGAIVDMLLEDAE